MIRHAVQASTKNFGGGRKAEVNHTRGVSDGQERYAVIRQGWTEGSESHQGGCGLPALTTEQFQELDFNTVLYCISLFRCQQTFSFFFPKTPQPSDEVPEKSGLPNFSLEIASFYDKSRLSIHLSLLLYFLTFRSLTLHFTTVGDRCHHRHTHVHIPAGTPGRRPTLTATTLRGPQAPAFASTPKSWQSLTFTLKLTLLINYQ